MTFPSANPAGENRWLVRNAVKSWLDAQNPYGVDEIRLTLEPVTYFDTLTPGQRGCVALVMVHLGNDSEDREALTGPDDPGGKMIHYDCELRIYHRGLNISEGWAEATRDYDRLVDSLKDCLRAQGRDLGRPDVILQAGDWPRQGGIEHVTQDPVEAEGVVDRWGSLRFTISQYLPTFVPGPPA